MQVCNYCGEPADTLDHVIPYSRLTSAKRTGTRADIGETVACCRECNSLLGAQQFPSIQDRSRFIGRRLKQRYAKLLNSPSWTADELAEVGPALRSSILADAKRRAVVRERIRYAMRA